MLIIALYSVYMLNLGLGPVFLDLFVNAEPFVSTPLELRALKSLFGPRLWHSPPSRWMAT